MLLFWFTDQLSHLSIAPAATANTTSSQIADITGLIRELKRNLRLWYPLRLSQERALNGLDLDEYFDDLNNHHGFHLLDRDIRQKVVRGEGLMVTLTGEVIDNVNQARGILIQWPQFEIRRHVRTLPHPEYIRFDKYGHMIDAGNHRCVISILNDEEMATHRRQSTNYNQQSRSLGEGGDDSDNMGNESSSNADNRPNKKHRVDIATTEVHQHWAL